MAKSFRYIVCAVAVAMCVPAAAKKPAEPTRPTLSEEQRQQFTYYWYAAKQAINEERYSDAFLLLTFCEQINPNDGSTLGYLGAVYDAMGQQERALQTYKRAFESDPHDQWYHYSVALMEQQTAEGRQQALQVLERAHEVNPKDEDLLEKLRVAYLYNADWKKALQTQDEIDAIKGYDVYSAYNRTRTYSLWNKPKKALAEIDRYLELEPTNMQFWLYRVEIMSRTGAKAKDIYPIYERILSFAPSDLGTLNNYAWLLATNKGDLRKAEQMSQITIREEPSNPVYLDTYAWILHLQGQDQLALFYLKKALWNAEGETREEIQKHIKAIEK